MFVQGFESLVLLFLTCGVVNNPYTFFLHSALQATFRKDSLSATQEHLEAIIIKLIQMA